MTTPRVRAKLPVTAILLVGAAYLVLALWVMRGVWGDPQVRLLGMPETKRLWALDRSDQQMVLATITGNASRMVSRPSMLFTEGQCHPLPRAYTFGEHMLGPSLLAAVPFALSGDPILSYNLMLVATLWIPAMAMFVFALGATRSVPAAFVAGLLFAFARVRIVDPVHPYVHGDLWTPLALTFLYRLFSLEDWVSALGLAVFTALELGESLYALLSAVLLLGVCGLFLALSGPRRFVRVLPKLVVAVLFVGLVAWLILGPYLETAKAWGAVQGRSSMFAFPVQFMPGQELFPGIVLVVLGAIGLLDRLRGGRPGLWGDVRVAIATGGFLTLWSSVWALPLPGTDVVLPSPLLLVQKSIPGLDSVRALYGIRLGVNLALCVLAGYGVLALIERLGAKWQAAVVAILSLAWLAEVHQPALAAFSFGSPLPHEKYRAGLSREDRALLRAIEPGPVLDYPPMGPNLLAQAHHLLIAAYHQQSTAACYNSFASPAREDVTRLAEALPDRGAADALASLGFETVILHRDLIPDELDADFEQRLAGLERNGQTTDHAVYRMRSQGTVASDIAMLGDRAVEPKSAEAAPPSASIKFEMKNSGDAIYRHPEPILPTPLIARWVDEHGDVVAEAEVRVLLPVALAPGGTTTRDVKLPVAVPVGSYTVTLSPRAAPSLVVAARTVDVRPAAAPTPGVAGTAPRQ